LCSLKAYYRVYKISPLAPILSQLKPVQTLTSYDLNITFNRIIRPFLPSIPRSPMWSPPFRVSD
jgi:hypothetical protein